MPRQPRARAGATVQLRVGEVASKIQAARSGLVPSEVKVADLILNDPSGVLVSSVSNVADRAGTAESTVIRACQRVGFKGFHDIKLALARDLAMQTRDAELARSETLGPGTSRSEIPGVILRESAAALQGALSTLDTTVYEEAVSAVADAKRVLVIGNGTSAAPAADAAYRLATLGLVVQAPADAFGQHLAARALDDRDVMIAVSHTGATRETLLAAEVAKRGGARLVAVTSYVRSPLTALVDHSLVVGGPELGFRQEAMTSRLAHLAVLDALFVGIAFAKPKRARDFLEVMAEVTADHTL